MNTSVAPQAAYFYFTRKRPAATHDRLPAARYWALAILPIDQAPLCMMMRRITRFFAGIGIFLLAATWWAVEYALPYWPIKPFRMNPAQATWLIPLGSDPAAYGLQAEPLTICTHDSLCLKALYIPATTAPATQDSSLCVVLIPGISSCKEFFLPTAQYFARHGINTLLLDQRAHGESGGEFCTFGFQEKYDISAAVDTLQHRYPHLRIGVMGHSLGGAVALQSLAHDSRLQFGIVESTFHNLEAVVEQYGENYFGIRSQWLARHTLDKSAAIAQFDPYAIQPCQSAEHIQQPVFMAHGDADERIPMEFGRINYEHLATPKKEWYTIPGAHHNNVWAAGGAPYQAAMMQFLERQRPGRSAGKLARG